MSDIRAWIACCDPRGTGHTELIRGAIMASAEITEQQWELIDDLLMDFAPHNKTDDGWFLITAATRDAVQALWDRYSNEPTKAFEGKGTA